MLYVYEINQSVNQRTERDVFLSGSKCKLIFVIHLAVCVGDTLMRTDSQHRRPHVGKMLMYVAVTPFRLCVTPSLNNPVRNVFRLEFSSKFLWPIFCLQTSASLRTVCSST